MRASDTPIATERAYVLAATRGFGARKHIIAGGKIGQNGTFKTLCGLWGAVNEMSWHAGDARRAEPGWCRSCLRSERKADRGEV